MKKPGILFTSDNSENSLNGLKYATELAKAKQSELDILKVLQESMEVEKNIPDINILIKELPDNFLYKEIVRRGEPSAEILHFATETSPELIIMSPDIFNKTIKRFEESVAGRVMKKSNYPILIISPKTSFKKLVNIVFITNIEMNTLKSVSDLLIVVKDLKPHINLVIVEDKIPTWHFRTDVSSLIKVIKESTNYTCISGSILEHDSIAMELGLYIEKEMPDMICVECASDIFYELFFNQEAQDEVSFLLNIPILILPRHWGKNILNS